MRERLSPRLAAIVDGLPLRAGMRVLEIGCGPGAAARAVAARIAPGAILAIDRSQRAIDQAKRAGGPPNLTYRCIDAEDFALLAGETPFDLAFAIRVGALDGRHPESGRRILPRIAAALVPGGRLFIDGGAAVREIPLDSTP